MHGTDDLRGGRALGVWPTLARRSPAWSWAGPPGSKPGRRSPRRAPPPWPLHPWHPPVARCARSTRNPQGRGRALGAGVFGRCGLRPPSILGRPLGAGVAHARHRVTRDAHRLMRPDRAAGVRRAVVAARPRLKHRARRCAAWWSRSTVNQVAAATHVADLRTLWAAAEARGKLKVS